MRITTHSDQDALHELYEQAVQHANHVGHIDWPSPFPSALVSELIDTEELYCFDGHETINGALRVSDQPDKRIWADYGKPALYLSKIATSDAVRGRGYLENVILPEVLSSALPNRAVRLDCLADSEGLQALYTRLGFVSLNDITFYSEKKKRDLIVTPFELQV